MAFQRPSKRGLAASVLDFHDPTFHFLAAGPLFVPSAVWMFQKGVPAAGKQKVCMIVAVVVGGANNNNGVPVFVPCCLYLVVCTLFLFLLLPLLISLRLSEQKAL